MFTFATSKEQTAGCQRWETRLLQQSKQGDTGGSRGTNVKWSD